MKGEKICDHPDLIAICMACTREDCHGECEAYRKKFRELAGISPEEKPKVKREKEPGETVLRYEAFGKRLTLKQWAEETGIFYHTLRKRLMGGMPIEKALTKKVRSGTARLITFEGKTLSISEWAGRAGILPETLRYRLKRGEPMPYALRQADGRIRKVEYCGNCAFHIGGGHCRLNVEGECREGGGYEAWKEAADGRNH